MWACGLPIVGTNVGGMPYLVRDGSDAILVPSEDDQAMANACLELLAKPEMALRLSENGRARAEALTWHRVKPIWEQVLFRNENVSSTEPAEVGMGSSGRPLQR
jgi:glycosyltransferase involved in cell wall biosynthesis